MGATQSADFAFSPKVWQDHIRAYFDKKLVYGAVAFRPEESLKEDAGKGDTVNFPYFKAIGAAEEPAENEGLIVDKLQDDSFSCTVKEVGKAVGIKKKAFKKSAATTQRVVTEIHDQIARVHAEKVDADLLTEFSTNGNYTQGFTATGATQVMNVRNLNIAKIAAFGDKADQSIVCFMHSLQFLDMMNDTTAGFLKADANDPFNFIDGFKGRLLGMGIITADSIPKGNDIDSKDAYHAFIHKMNPYGIIQKQDMEIESDYDILQREWVFTGNEWYGVKSFHGKVNALDKRTARVTTTVSEADGA
jgi:hypothetical protein